MVSFKLDGLLMVSHLSNSLAKPGGFVKFPLTF